MESNFGCELFKLYSDRKETIRIDWAAYPHYQAPEKFAPFLLDGHHLYYINAFENAASTMETSYVFAENIARIILSRLPVGHLQISRSETYDSSSSISRPLSSDSANLLIQKHPKQ